MATPNIFTYATSELSQDAFILWLLDWANPKNANTDKSLCETAQAFVRLLLGKKELEITSVKCKKQEHHIDVFATINEKYAIIIEDKTNTSEHSNQIQRYFAWAQQEKKYSSLEVYCAYYKTGNESVYKLKCLAEKYEKEFPSERFSVITRKDMLEVLSSCTTTNSIFRDYVAHLQEIQEQTDAYKSFAVKEWKWRAWQGFYLNLEDALKVGDWGYVANQSGGFWGYWWHFRKTGKNPFIELYLQFEQDKLCVKACNKSSDKVSIGYSNKVCKFAKENDIFTENFKRRTGKTMTLAVIKLQNFETLNMSELMQQLKKVEKFIDDISPLL